jgi:hypothetical protein
MLTFKENWNLMKTGRFPGHSPAETLLLLKWRIKESHKDSMVVLYAYLLCFRKDSRLINGGL